MSEKMIKRFLKNDAAKAFWQIFLGCVLAAAAYPLFLVPNNIAPGGVTGVATILNYLFGLPVGVTSMVMNLPLFFFGYKRMGRMFVIRSLFATVLFSALIDLIALPPLTNDVLLASVYGGILLGVGLGLIIRGGATTGGSDMLARVVHRRFPFISVGLFLFLIDFCVIVAAGFTMSAEAALYALINIFIGARVLDLVFAGFGTSKACFIISDCSARIAKRITAEMNRGATLFAARGAYSDQPKDVILCVMSGREILTVKQIVRQEDARAFVVITDTHETLGEGFSSLDAED